MTRIRSIGFPACAAAVAAATLLLSAGPVSAGEFKRITTSKQYRAAVVGRTIVGGGASYVVHANGTLTGRSPKGAKVKGTWTWRGKFWCRKATVGNDVIAHDCQQVFISGKTLRFVRNRGHGSTVEARLR